MQEPDDEHLDVPFDTHLLMVFPAPAATPEGAYQVIYVPVGSGEHTVRCVVAHLAAEHADRGKELGGIRFYSPEEEEGEEEEGTNGPDNVEIWGWLAGEEDTERIVGVLHAHKPNMAGPAQPLGKEEARVRQAILSERLVGKEIGIV